MTDPAPIKKIRYKVTNKFLDLAVSRLLDPNATLAMIRPLLKELMPTTDDLFTIDGVPIGTDEEASTLLSEIVPEGPKAEVTLDNPVGQKKKDADKKAKQEGDKEAAAQKARDDEAAKKLEEAATKINTAPYTPTLKPMELPEYKPAEDHTPELGMGAGTAGKDRTILTKLKVGEVRQLLKLNRINLNNETTGLAAAFVIADGLCWATYDAVQFSAVDIKSTDISRMDESSFAYSEYESQLQKQTVASGSAGGGIPLIFRVDTSYRHSNATSTFNKQVEIHLQCSQLIPKARVVLKEKSISISPETIDAIRDAVASPTPAGAVPKLLGVLEAHGQFVGTDLMLGGRISLSSKKTLSDSYTFAKAEHEFKVAVDARFTAEGVPVEAGGGAGGLKSDTESTKEILQRMNLRLELRGGDESTASSRSDQLGRDWIPTLAQFPEWKVVGFYQRSLVPIFDYLEPGLRNKCINVLKSYFVSQLKVHETKTIGSQHATPFKHEIGETKRIADVKINWGENIDGLQVTYATIHNQTLDTEWLGRRRGHMNSHFRLAPDEEISEVEVGCKDGDTEILHRLAFKTTKGARHPTSGYYGTANVPIKTLSAPRVRGFTGTSGTLLDSIGLRYLDLTESTKSRAFLLAIEPYLFDGFVSDNMQPGEVLNPGESISSANGQYTLVYQGDGNLALYRNRDRQDRQWIWDSKTGGKSSGRCVMQPDGNLVIYDPKSNVLWASGTSAHAGSHLVAQDDGNVVIFGQDGTRVWATRA